MDNFFAVTIVSRSQYNKSIMDSNEHFNDLLSHYAYVEHGIEFSTAKRIELTGCAISEYFRIYAVDCTYV